MNHRAVIALMDYLYIYSDHSLGGVATDAGRGGGPSWHEDSEGNGEAP